MYHLYEISTRPFLHELSQKLGKKITLKDVPMDFFEELAEMGINVVWMMGIWKLGKKALAFDRSHPPHQENFKKVLPGHQTDDTIGSPYAVVKYECNPEIGTDEDILEFKGKLNALGLKLMLDFVPNHFAPDGELRDIDPACFVQKPPHAHNSPANYHEDGIAYGKDMYSGAWMDTIQLNYWNPKTRDYMKEQILRIGELSDGVRCDMAMLVLNWVIEKTWSEQLNAYGYKKPASEFWGEAIAAAKQLFPDMIFMAECYWNTEETLFSLGFDYCYDKELYDKLESGHMDNLRGYIHWRGLNYFKKAAHFIENHDEPRAPVAFHSLRRANAAAVVTMALPGLRFYNHGQFQGRSNRLAVHLRRAADEAPHPETEAFYKKLVKAISSPVFNKGNWTVPLVTGENSWKFLSFAWSYNGETCAVIVNYTDAMADARIVLPDAQSTTPGDNIPIVELLCGEKYERSLNEIRTKGLHVVIDSFVGHIYKIC